MCSVLINIYKKAGLHDATFTEKYKKCGVKMCVKILIINKYYTMKYNAIYKIENIENIQYSFCTVHSDHTISTYTSVPAICHINNMLLCWCHWKRTAPPIKWQWERSALCPAAGDVSAGLSEPMPTGPRPAWPHPCPMYTVQPPGQQVTRKQTSGSGRLVCVWASVEQN